VVEDFTTIQQSKGSFGSREKINLCHPDDRKSCAACCGLYNVPVATRPELLGRLRERTLCFQATQRSVDAVAGFEAVVRTAEADSPLDQAIHVCGYTGFVDSAFRCVGCMLHPLAPGNNGIDFRGLCHYGSMACKTFYCTAWQDLPPSYLQLVCDIVDDWHLYGLVITDVDFVFSVFNLLEESLGCQIDPSMIQTGEARIVLKKMFSWKTSWPFCGTSVRRRSRYYARRQASSHGTSTKKNADQLMASLQFTFDVHDFTDGASDLIHQTIADFVRAYRHQLNKYISHAK
jgi:hypothetical protein